MSLRTKLIRLAFENPDLREDLLPLLADKHAEKMKAPKNRNPVVQESVQRNWGAGGHHNRHRDVEKGRSRKPKHKRDLRRDHE